ncbi:hypothetical protein KIN20_033650 [Parelaphostrongylus tenuis]|uniref:Uncharacterized protein n=1 Tax=Parelaphostrongylus tenuis TaxID=148309 RepID=A0AAD5WJE2_PARTN|nr:hypothetical protein KIN20_033650 [Parelaphostrongylus tenuis]
MQRFHYRSDSCLASIAQRLRNTAAGLLPHWDTIQPSKKLTASSDENANKDAEMRPNEQEIAVQDGEESSWKGD